MTEIKKLTKIALIIALVVTLLFGTMLTFLYDLTMNPEGWTNPYYPRFFGGVAYLSAFFAIIMLTKKEWEAIRMTFAYLFGLFLPTLIIEISVLVAFGSTFKPITVQLGLSVMPVEAGMLILGIVTYLMQRR